MMKKISLLLLAISFLLVSCTDNEGVSKAFAKYKHEDGVVAITVPGFAIRLATLIADLDEREEELLDNIDKVKVLAIEDEKINSSINLHDEFADMISGKGYEELLVVKDDNQSVTIVGKMDEKNVIREMVILVGGDDNALVYVKGTIKPELLNDYINLADHDDFLSLEGLDF